MASEDSTGPADDAGTNTGTEDAAGEAADGDGASAVGIDAKRCVPCRPPEP
jgi:hypothetical protein